MFHPKINHLLVIALAKIPNMQLMTVAATQQMVGLQPLLYLIGSPPLAADVCVVTQMPPEIVRQFLRSTIDFPAAEHVKVIMIEKEDSTWPGPIGCTKRADVNAFRTRSGRYVAGNNPRA